MTPSRESRFVPVLRQELVELLRDRHEGEEREQFARCAALLQATLHYEFHDRLERLKELYRPFDPDPIATTVLESEGEADPAPLLDELRGLLAQANFREVTRDDLTHAFEEESLFTLTVTVDLDDYTEMLLYRRGECVRQDKVRSWRTLWKWKDIEVDLYERLVMAIRLKPEALDAHRKLGRVREMEADKLYLKFFKNIPKADLEMLFPTTQVGIKMGDKVKLYGGLFGGMAPLLIKLIAAVAVAIGGVSLLKDAEELSLQLLGAVLIGAGIYLFKTFNSYKTTKLNYVQTLSEGLYFKNLDNNIGVIHHLLSAAEEEEIKEALLAYDFLLRADGPLTQRALDQRVEQWFAERFDRHFDFEVDDGLAKLERLGLIKQKGDAYTALPLTDALRVLDERWDGYFKYSE